MIEDSLAIVEPGVQVHALKRHERPRQHAPQRNADAPNGRRQQLRRSALCFGFPFPQSVPLGNSYRFAFIIGMLHPLGTPRFSRIRKTPVQRMSCLSHDMVKSALVPDSRPSSRPVSSVSLRRREKEEMHGQAYDDASRVHEVGRRHRGRHCRCCARGRRAGRVEHCHCKQGGRHQARAFLLPRLRQDGMRRVGYRRKRSRHPHRGRRERLPFHGQPLRQGSGVAAGGVSPRPPVPSDEAHECARRGRSRLGAHHVGRGDEHHRREAAGNHRPLRRRGHLRHVRHVAHLGHVRLRRARPAGRQPEHVHPVAGVQGPASSPPP